MVGVVIPLKSQPFMNRRNFLSSTGILVAGSSLNALMPRTLAASEPSTKADYSFRIEAATFEIGPGAYPLIQPLTMARFPGPMALPQAVTHGLRIMQLIKYTK